MNTLNLTGKKFGKLTVIERAENKNNLTAWICDCECGTKGFIARGTRLNKGQTDNCGCERGNKVRKARTKHGMRNTNFYHVWISMKQRCINPNSHSAKHYYKKGIRVCDEWMEFENFFNDMYGTYQEGLYIDRIDNSLGYNKENCRWVTVLESNRNKTTTQTKGEI